MHLPLHTSSLRLREHAAPFLELFNAHGVTIELYAPRGRDLQQPHDRDEIYVVAAGSGTFRNGHEVVEFRTGDVLFVRAGVEHRFETFTDDFRTWVIFTGPVGGHPA